MKRIFTQAQISARRKRASIRVVHLMTWSGRRLEIRPLPCLREVPWLSITVIVADSTCLLRCCYQSKMLFTQSNTMLLTLFEFKSSSSICQTYVDYKFCSFDVSKAARLILGFFSHKFVRIRDSDYTAPSLILSLQHNAYPSSHCKVLQRPAVPNHFWSTFWYNFRYLLADCCQETSTDMFLTTTCFHVTSSLKSARALSKAEYREPSSVPSKTYPFPPGPVHTNGVTKACPGVPNGLP